MESTRGVTVEAAESTESDVNWIAAELTVEPVGIDTLENCTATMVSR